MKQHLHSYRLLLIAAAICTLAAFWLLGARIGVEQTQRQVDVVISYEDTVRLADASGVPVQEWLTQLSDAGVRELLVTPDEQAKPDIVRAAQDAGLTLAQAGGLAQGGTYFFAARYDTLAAAGQTGVDTDTEPERGAQPGFIPSAARCAARERQHARAHRGQEPDRLRSAGRLHA